MFAPFAAARILHKGPSPPMAMGAKWVPTPTFKIRSFAELNLLPKLFISKKIKRKVIFPTRWTLLKIERVGFEFYRDTSPLTPYQLVHESFEVIASKTCVPKLEKEHEATVAATDEDEGGPFERRSSLDPDQKEPSLEEDSGFHHEPLLL
ncbi:hypothetical protein NL676_004024 [Syzygium grande]|nr:hypothetical protein NL676_004024 [Syzygium grande]